MICEGKNYTNNVLAYRIARRRLCPHHLRLATSMLLNKINIQTDLRSLIMVALRQLQLP